MPAAAYTHVIWDWNGTLLDDAWLCAEIDSELLVRQGRPPLTLERYRECIGFPIRDYYQQLGFDLEAETYDAVASGFFDEYRKRCGECALRPGASETLALLARNGMSQSVLSAYQHDALEELLAEHGIRDHFAHVLGLDDHYVGSKAENGRRLLALLGCAPEEVLMIGDTDHDAEVAEAMGCDCILIAGGHLSRPRLEAAGVPVLDDLHDLAALLDGP